MTEKPTDYTALSLDELVSELDKIEYPLKGMRGENSVGVSQLLLTHAAYAANGLPSAMVRHEYGISNAATQFAILALALDKLRKKQPLVKSDENALSNARQFLSAICKSLKLRSDDSRDTVQGGKSFTSMVRVLEIHDEKVDPEQIKGHATDQYFQYQKQIAQINVTSTMLEALCKKLNIPMRDEPWYEPGYP